MYIYIYTYIYIQLCMYMYIYNYINTFDCHLDRAYGVATISKLLQSIGLFGRI